LGAIAYFAESDTANRVWVMIGRPRNLAVLARIEMINGER
jgi:hypothetical protein